MHQVMAMWRPQLFSTNSEFVHCIHSVRNYLSRIGYYGTVVIHGTDFELWLKPNLYAWKPTCLKTILVMLLSKRV